jgi:gas vesicle protein
MADRDDFGAFLIGFVVGGLTGAVISLLFAPQSGEETRTVIREKSIELRDKAAEQAELVASKAGKFAEDTRLRGKEIYDDAVERGKEVYDDAMGRGKVAIEGVKKAVAKKKPAEPTA